jgi:NAD(P)H-dependent FMN reductase
MLNIKVIVGTTRQGRLSDQFGKWIADRAKAKGLTIEILDLRDYPLPFFEEAITPSSKKEPYANPIVKQWTNKIAEADGYIMTVAEYNHSFPAVLKNAIDYVSPEWNKKPVAFVGYGTVGAARAIEHLRGVMAELQTVAMRPTVHVSGFWNLMNDKGVIDLTSFETAADTMIDHLIWWGNALKDAKAKDMAVSAAATSVVK